MPNGGREGWHDVSPATTTPQVKQRESDTHSDTLDLISGAIALILAVGVLLVLLTHSDVPVWYTLLLGQVITFYFGRSSKATG
jgi:hypothetical protein